MKKLKKFNRNENGSIKKKIIIGIYAFLIIGIILTGASYAVYQQEAEVTFINARVGNFKQNDIELAIKLDGKEVEVPPEKNSLYTVTVDCDNADGSWDMNEWLAKIGNISAGKVKCEVNFNTPAPTLSDVTATSEKTSITLSYTAGGMGVTTTCKWGTEEVSEDEEYPNVVKNPTNTGCNIDGLEMDTTYYYQVCAVNTGGEVCRNGNVKTKPETPPIADKVEIGDYISMTPTSTSYVPSINMTELKYTGSYTLNPSELNLWRVIRKNSDGTVDVVSVHMSSGLVRLQGISQWSYSVEILDTVAQAYTNDEFVLKARNFGYNGQRYICLQSEENCRSEEMYERDYKDTINAFGTAATTTVDGSSYWYYTSSRAFPEVQRYRTLQAYLGNNNYEWRCYDDCLYNTYTSGKCSSSKEKIYINNYSMMLISDDGEPKVGSKALNTCGQSDNIDYRVRPVLTLKSDLELKDGDGKSSSGAYVLSRR